MVTVVQGKVCAKNHPDRLSRLATVHQRYRQTDGRTDGRISYGIGLDLTVGQKSLSPDAFYWFKLGLYLNAFVASDPVVILWEHLLAYVLQTQLYLPIW